MACSDNFVFSNDNLSFPLQVMNIIIIKRISAQFLSTDKN